MELNKEDGGNRQFILCTNNENNICEEVTYERVKRVINGYPFKWTEKKDFLEEKVTYTTLKKSQQIQDEIERIKEEYGVRKDFTDEQNADRWKIRTQVKNDVLKVWWERKIDDFKKWLGWNLRYLKTDFVQKNGPDRVSDEDKIRLSHNIGCMIALKENTFDEIEKTEFYQVFESKKQITAIYFRENKQDLDSLVQSLADKGKQIKMYIFSWNKGEYKHMYPEYPNVICEDIPEPILEVYKNIGL